MMVPNALLAERAVIVPALSNTTPSSSTPRRVSLKNFERCTVVISALNASTVTGSAITLKQSTDIADANSDEKAVAFTSVLRTLDVGAGEVLSSAAVASNTFTTDSTNAKELLYIIDVTPEMLDIDNGFDCFRVGTGDGTATTLTVLYILESKYGKAATSHPLARAN